MTSSSTATTSSATGSMSRPGWRHWRSRAASASRGWCATRSATSCPTPLKTWESRASRTSLGRCARTRCGPRPSALCRRRMRQPLRNPPARRRTASVDRRAAVRQSQQRSGAAIFRGRDHRGPYDRFVAARGHVCDLAQYRVHLSGKRVDTKQIGRELGVRYVLEGSVRRSGNRARINAQLIDAE